MIRYDETKYIDVETGELLTKRGLDKRVSVSGESVKEMRRERLYQHGSNVTWAWDVVQVKIGEAIQRKLF